MSPSKMKLNDSSMLLISCILHWFYFSSQITLTGLFVVVTYGHWPTYIFFCYLIPDERCNMIKLEFYHSISADVIEDIIKMTRTTLGFALFR